MSDDDYSEPSMEMSGEKKGDAYDYFLKKKKAEAGEEDDSDDGAPISDSDDDEDFTPLDELKKEMTEKAPAQPSIAMDDDDMELS